MRTLPSVALVVAITLACGGGGRDPETAPTPAAPAPEPSAPAPAAPAPEVVVAPASTGEIHAVVAPYYGRDVAVACFRGGARVDCPIGPCGDDGVCEGGAPVRTLTVAVTTEDGHLEVPLGTGRVAAFHEEFCEGVEATAVEGPVGASGRRRFASLEADDPALAPVRALLGAGDSIGTAWRLDVDNDGSDEILAEVWPERGSLLVLLRPGRDPQPVYDTRREPLPDDADEQAQAEYALGEATLRWLGVTDAHLDGRLEIVAEGSAYESSWVAVLGLDGSTLASVSCAL